MKPTIWTQLAKAFGGRRLPAKPPQNDVPSTSANVSNGSPAGTERRGREQYPDEIRPGLFLGGVYTLPFISELGITHVLSIMRHAKQLDEIINYTKDLKLLTVDAEDILDYNLLEQIPLCLAFIKETLADGGKLLVHCMAGVSRSATVVAAYLMVSEGLSAAQAVDAVRAKRPEIRPNLGFLHQLQLFERMACQLDLAHKSYTYFATAGSMGLRWDSGNTGSIALSPGAASESVLSQESLTTYQCKQCKHELASSNHQVAPEARFPKEQYGWIVQRYGLDGHRTLAEAVFLEPQDWMAEAVKSQTVGLLLCPGCSASVGSFNREGGMDADGAWVVPAYQLHLACIHNVGPGEA